MFRRFWYVIIRKLNLFLAKITWISSIVIEYYTDKIHKVYTGSSKKMDGIWNRYNLKSTRRIYTFGV